MRLILTEERADFDTIAAMLGMYLLTEDGILILPEQFTQRAAAFLTCYFHKLPFEHPGQYRDQAGNWIHPGMGGLIFGFDFLQSLQVAGRMQAAQVKTDPFYASVLLLGIHASMQNLESFSAESALHQVVPYLMEQGADEALARTWLEGTFPANSQELPHFRANPMPQIEEQWQQTPSGQHRLADMLVDTARALQFPVYLVGGMVRDLLLGKSCRDLDFVVEGDALLLAKALRKRFGGHVASHAPFGTARWELDEAFYGRWFTSPGTEPGDDAGLPTAVDLISARGECYPVPAQLPVVRRGGIELDLRRRDFTINALGLRLDRSPLLLLDACGGLQDLEQGLIRALHPLSFRDDPTRLFRAVRYAQRLGFEIEAQTQAWMGEALPMVSQVSGDRLRHELNLILLEPQPQAHLEQLAGLGILAAIQPGLRWENAWGEWLESLMASPAGSLPEQVGNLNLRQFLGYGAWLALHDIHTVNAVCERLRFSNGHVKAFTALADWVGNPSRLHDLSNSELTRLLDSHSLETLHIFDVLAGSDSPLRERLHAYRSRYRNFKPYTNGATLLNMDVPQGRLYQVILDQLRDAWLDECVCTEAQEKALLAQLLDQYGVRNDG
ncbi:MAG: CCA tRNA nucleotidyltransferase [Anaerolineae bacterium]|nr:CCA tRNA nucleotidyltransferase [Anaerolineae bacterium]